MLRESISMESRAFKRSAEILESITGTSIERITPETSLLDDLGIDSLDRVELALEIESEFGVDLDDDDLERIKTVDDLAKRIARWDGGTQR